MNVVPPPHNLIVPPPAAGTAGSSAGTARPSALATTAAVLGGAAAGVWALQRYFTLPPAPNRLNWAPGIYGHRGCRLIPGIVENTARAYQYAVAQGSDGVECDVRMTKDGQLVVFHDHILQRAMEVDEAVGAQPPSNFTLHELRAMRFREDVAAAEAEGGASPKKSKKHAHAPAELLTLDELVALCSVWRSRIMIEAKLPLLGGNTSIATMADAIVVTFQKHAEFLYEHGMVISFNWPLLYAIRSRDPRIAVMVLHPQRPLVQLVEPPRTAIARAVQRWLPTTLFEWFARLSTSRVALELLGASAAGYHFKGFAAATLAQLLAGRRFCYLWAVAEPAATGAAYRGNGVALGVDQHHGEYRWLPKAE